MDAGWIHDHFGKLQTFGKTVASFANSTISSLKKCFYFYRIPYQLFEAMLQISNAANAQYILYLNDKTKSLGIQKPQTSYEPSKRFELNWEFYKGKLTNTFKLNIIM